jgi:hypothetical protein
MKITHLMVTLTAGVGRYANTPETSDVANARNNTSEWFAVKRIFFPSKLREASSVSDLEKATVKRRAEEDNSPVTKRAKIGHIDLPTLLRRKRKPDEGADSTQIKRLKPGMVKLSKTSRAE